MSSTASGSGSHRAWHRPCSRRQAVGNVGLVGDHDDQIAALLDSLYGLSTPGKNTNFRQRRGRNRPAVALQIGIDYAVAVEENGSMPRDEDDRHFARPFRFQTCLRSSSGGGLWPPSRLPVQLPRPVDQIIIGVFRRTANQQTVLDFLCCIRIAPSRCSPCRTALCPTERSRDNSAPWRIPRRARSP